MSRRWRQQKRPKWVDRDPRKNGWSVYKDTSECRVWINNDGIKFYERW